MKNKVLKAIGYTVAFIWAFTACAIDSEGTVGTVMFIINIVCMAYLALFSYANDWWEGYEEKPHGKNKRKSRKTYPNSRTPHSRNERVNGSLERRSVSTTSALS